MDKPRKPEPAPAEIKIDPIEFKVPAQDAHGHSARVQFRVAPYMMRDVEVLLTKWRDWAGWETASDLYRWALRRGIEWLARRTPDERIRDTIKRNAVILDAVLGKQVELDFLDTVRKVEEMAESLRMRGMEEDAVHLLLDVRKTVDGMQDDRWRKRWIVEFDRRFGHMLRAAKLDGLDEE